MKRSRLKRLLLVIACSLGAVSVGAQTTITHTVSHGETLRGIASRYGITEQQLVDANPGADRMIYVGMELTVPVVPVDGSERQEATPRSTGAQQVQSTPARQQTQQHNAQPVTEKPRRKLTQSTPGYYPAKTEQNGKNQPASQATNTSTGQPVINWSQTPQQSTSSAYPSTQGNYHPSSTPWGKVVEDRKSFRLRVEANCAYIYDGPIMPGVSFGFSYFFTDGFYAGLRVGYRAFLYSGDHVEATMHLIGGIPEIGYEFAFGADKAMSLSPFIAGDLFMPLSTTVKQDGMTVAVKDVSLCADGKVGLRFSYSGVSLAVAANMAIGRDGRLIYGKQIYPSVALGYSF